jgi:hypothetical protein
MVIKDGATATVVVVGCDFSKIDIIKGELKMPYTNPMSKLKDSITTTILVKNDGILSNITTPGFIVPNGTTLNGTLPGMVVQSISLSSGWNLVSFNVDISDKSLNSVFSSIAPHGQSVQSIFSNATFSSGSWSGFSSIDNSQAYQVRVDSDVVLTVSGVPISSSTPIALSTGWNYVPYYPSSPRALTTALASILPYVTKVQDEAGNAYENLPGLGWVNNIGTMKPGEGYKILVSSDCTLIYGS